MGDKEKLRSLLESGDLTSAISLASSSEIGHELFSMIGGHFSKNGETKKAKIFYLRSMEERPNAEAEFGFGSSLLEEGRANESIEFFKNSIKDKSYSIPSLLKMGQAHRLTGNIADSLKCYLCAKSLGHGGFVLDINIATLLSDLGEFDRANEFYERGFAKAPDNEKVRFNYSLHLLARGDYKMGLEFYESRPWCFKGFGKQWSGERGADVMILSEQGHGDLIQFARFIPELKKVSRSISLVCDKNISRFVSTLGCVDEIIDLDSDSIRRASNRYPTYCRVLSIPWLMGLNVKSSSAPYLHVDPDRSTFWKDFFSKDKGAKIGLCWQGGKRNDAEMMFNDKKRSIELSSLSAILDMDGANFYSLQKDWREFHPRIKYPMDFCGDFLDTASLIDNLDLVISVDTSIAHVAGAIGKPVWMMSRLGGCWRWGNHGGETFWYPSMRIFRQELMDEWGPVVNEVERNLADFLSSR